MRLRSSFAPIVMLLSLSIGLSGCGGKDKVTNENAPLEGRDKELYEQASEKARKGRYDEARLLYNVVITTYADSEFLPLAKLAIADSFYLEGGTSNLQQAIGGYKDFAQYFPTHPRICEVKHKIAHSLMRQMGAYNRDASFAKQAEFQLKAALQSCRQSPNQLALESDLRDVQQVLGLHELDIARFYINNRQAYKSGESRLRDIITQYPFFSYFDESLFLLGVSLIEQEQPEEASEYFTRLVRDYPRSEFSEKGREYLEKLGKPIPDPANDNPVERPGFMGKFSLILGYNGLDISKDGVLLSKSGDEKDVEAEVKPDEASNNTGTRGIRASTKVDLTNPAPATSSAPAGEKPTAGGSPEAKPDNPESETKAEAKKDEKKKKDPKKKKGFLGGIFK